jgi:glutathione synthase
VRGKLAAFRRVGSNGDLRSNMHAGGEAVAAEVTDGQLAAAELVRPRLIRDGMFLVGLDLVGDKLLEVNVFSPGGLYSAQKTTGTEFIGAIVDAIEAKVAARRLHPGAFTNRELATL